MRVVDVAAFIGAYPFRHLDRAGSTDWLLSQMDRLHIDRALVGYLPSILHQDPAPGNRVLAKLTASYGDRLAPVPTINPEQPQWQDDVNLALESHASAVRLFPQYQGVDPSGDAMRVAVAAVAVAGLPMVLTVRLEDLRQRHPRDVTSDLTPAAIRGLVRSDDDVRLIVTHADRAFVEEVHFGLTPAEADRILWDISWMWGPPEDDLTRLIETVGRERFVFGTGMPLRVGDTSIAKLDLAEITDDDRRSILGENIERWLISLPSREFPTDA
jgi:predicted TIM-barrel fold metal-dependent hydrolase